MRSAAQPDLFAALAPGPTAAAAPVDFDQPEVPPKPEFDARYGWRMFPPRGGHTADTIRVIAHTVLADARAAATLTWTPRHVRAHTAGMMLWSEWLKNGEGDRLLADFKAEMDRLGTPDDQVSPGWAQKWGLPDWARDD